MMETQLGGDSVQFTGFGRSEISSQAEKDEEENSYFNLKKPQSWSDCIHILWTKPEDKVLLVQNPDGLLYLSYLKYCGQLFSLCK